MRKNILMIIALLCMVVQTAWAQFSGGSGTQAAPCQISLVDDRPTDLASINQSEYVVQDGESLTGMLGNATTISIAAGATVTLMGVTIPGGGNANNSHAGLTCLGDATIILGDGTENTVRGYYLMSPGIYIPEGKTLTIEGNGTLNAANNSTEKCMWAAGIGGGYETKHGNIIIKGGVINATGSEYAPGIGSGYLGHGGYIRIEGGRVNATGGRKCPGIGGGYLGSTGPVIITQDAEVTAVAGADCTRSIGKSEQSWYEESVTIGCTLDSEGNPVGGQVGGISISPFTYFHYTIAFDGNGGSGSMATQETGRGFDSELTLTNGFTREGYTFMGWIAENVGTKKFYPDNTKYSDLDIVPNTTITFYAQWIMGEGTEAAPYEIASEGNWLTMAHYINNGGGAYNNKHYKLMADISVTETMADGVVPVSMIGIGDERSFKGTFDGNGHTITLNYTDNRLEHYCGPFRIISGATIKNLHVAGTIVKATWKHVGGIVGKALGTNTITNCRSSVDIQVNTDGDCSSGGFIGDLRDGTTTLTGCTFDGKLRGPGGTTSRSTKWGGFIGWVAKGNKANFNVCVFAPAEISINSKSDSRTFARFDDGADVTQNNCYYFETLGIAQGKQVYSITADEHVNMSFDTAPVSRYDVSGIDSYSDGDYIKYNNVMCSAGGKDVYLNLSQDGDTPTDYVGDSFIATPGSQLTKPQNNTSYLLKMPNANVTISLFPIDWAGSGKESAPFLIYNVDQWNQLAKRVNEGTSTYSGKFFKLMADITVTETVNEGNAVTMVGCSNDLAFSGTFDGDGHTITLAYTDNTSNDFCAPFRYIKNANIKNLHVDGTITKAGGQKAAGLVGKAMGSNSIGNCRSSVDILFDKGGDVSSGGFIGELLDGNTTTLTNCLFDGKLRGMDAYDWGGFVGWVSNNNTVKINNCLFSPAEVSIASNNGNKTFARYRDNEGVVALNNSYFKTLINAAQDAFNAATGYNNDNLCIALGNGWNIFDGKVLPIMGSYSFDGDGTQASPYIIASAADWNGLSTNMARGETYSGKYFQLAADITVSRMLGSSSENYFQGNFDGAGNTLTFNYNAYREGIAPFGYVGGATIENLHIAGTIRTSGSFVSGLIIGTMGENAINTIRNCRNSITFDCTAESSSGLMYGGYISLMLQGTTVFTGCVFDGNFASSVGYGVKMSAGFVASKVNKAEVYFNDCVFDPATPGVSFETFKHFVGSSDQANCYFNNSYYTINMEKTENPQGKDGIKVLAGSGVKIEGNGTVTEYDVSRITGYLTGIKYNGALYATSNEEVRLNIDYERPGYTVTGYTVTSLGTPAGTITGTENPYTLIITNPDILRATVSVTTEKNVLALIDGADNKDIIEKYDGQIAEVTYDREFSAIDNGDGTWTPRCYTICLPYDFNLYDHVESGQASLYRLKYVNSEDGQFIFTNDFGFASAGMGWLLVVNHGTVSLNVPAATISAQTKSEEVLDYQGAAPTTVPQLAGYWTGTFGRIYDEEAEPLHAYGMSSDGLWQRCRVAGDSPRQSWIETFRAFFQTADSYDTDTFTPMYTFTGAADEIETGEVEAFPTDHFAGDIPDGQATAVHPVIRTVEADGTSRYFDLYGRRIETKPVRGVYIHNGKKFVSNPSR